MGQGVFRLAGLDPAKVEEAIKVLASVRESGSLGLSSWPEVVVQTRVESCARFNMEPASRALTCCVRQDWWVARIQAQASGEFRRGFPDDVHHTRCGAAPKAVTGLAVRDSSARSPSIRSDYSRSAQEVRGSSKVTDQDPEGKFEALAQYARDLTQAAREGKLDPVIGRDEQIRRAFPGSHYEFPAERSCARQAASEHAAACGIWTGCLCMSWHDSGELNPAAMLQYVASSQALLRQLGAAHMSTRVVANRVPNLAPSSVCYNHRRTIQILSRRTKNNPCIIGEAGVGKTAVVEGLAQRIVTQDVPDSLQVGSVAGLGF